MIAIFEKLFCKHKWKTHIKKEYEWEETQIVDGTKMWYKPVIEVQIKSETTEVLICESCGKIKVIEY